MKIYIPETHQGQFSLKELFLLVRPFRTDTSWVDDAAVKSKWNLNPNEFEYTSNFNESDCVILPRTLNYYIENGFFSYLQTLNAQCAETGKKGYAYIAGDFGEAFPSLSHFVYFRMGGFRSQLTDNNRSFPSALSDYLLRLYQTEDIAPIPWSTKPVVGFCGQANLSRVKAGKEKLKFLIENTKRFFRNPFRTDYEPLFASGYERAKLLKQIESSNKLDTRFIYRDQYRAGANTPEIIEKTTKEYYDNLRESQYVICVRGGGNFSVRFYQTLMMGRIPVFINTDCLLPFEDNINWKKQVVWVEWNERHLIAEKIEEFHNRYSANEFVALQQANRSIWKNELSLAGMLNFLKRTT